uniref:Uncharacterized protein n=1 Tax=Oryza nivara TaxID=4536 RepID=A0A1Y8Z4P4_ORYNI
MNVKPSR